MRVICLAILIANIAIANENEWFIKIDETVAVPPPPERTIDAAETVDEYVEPPEVEERETETEPPPAPDYLIGKVIWGESASFTGSSGRKLAIDDWNLINADVEKFVHTGKELGLTYHWSNTNLNEFSYNPKRLPCLMFSGVRTMRLDDAQMKAVRQYILKGGMVICDSVYGSPYFYESAKSSFETMFPEETVRRVPLDHPIFHIFHRVDKAVYPEEPGLTEPFLECIYVGSRIGILFSKHGLGTGWQGDQRIFGALKGKGLKPKYFDVDTARKIGINIAGYIVGYADVGLLEGTPELFGLPDQKRPTDEFVFAQLKHSGSWNVHPGAAPSMLMNLRQRSAIRINLKRIAVDPDTDDLSDFPFLYLTGLDNFSFSNRATSVLREFIENSGILLINNGLGMATFDEAVKRELRKILPDATLERIPSKHDIFNNLLQIANVRYSPSLADSQPDLSEPVLFGASIDGELRVIYSPYDMEAGWLDAYYPLIRGYDAVSAQQLGMNLITYIMTQ
jgi:hypothetical protein